MDFVMHKQAEVSNSRGYKGIMCTECLGSYTGTTGQHTYVCAKVLLVIIQVQWKVLVVHEQVESKLYLHLLKTMW